jgi:hypothetical protein
MLDGTTQAINLDLNGVLQTVTVALLLSFFGSVNKLRDQLTRLTKETKEWQAKVDVALFGATGDNGLHGTVKDHEARLRSLEQHPSERP